VQHNRAKDYTVLVADDLADARIVLRLMLELRGYNVVEARNGEEAVELIRVNCPDLVLMDLNMPVMDGLTATAAIREMEESCREVPIIAVTAHDTYGISKAALEAGCNAYLTKPFDTSQLDRLFFRYIDSGDGG
jgi:two-component system, cell cycle response regulator DivK